MALVRRLRQRLQAVGVSDWLETIYGMGYRLNPNV
ncbi:MAG: helix-turn-helix domain-containing protein [Leptodesmis sp.]